MENPQFHQLYEDYVLLSENAEEELLLPYEPDNGNVEYKLKLQSLTMDRVDHLTTQLIWRLEEGDGTAFYQIGVLDSGQVTGLNEEELSETLIAIFFMASTLQPQAQVSMHKVRAGTEGFSCMLKVVKKNVCAENDQRRFLMVFQEETPLIRRTSNDTLQVPLNLEEEKDELGEQQRTPSQIQR